MAAPANPTIASSTAIDLSQLPPPDVVELLDYETLLASMRADFVSRYPEFSAFVESDPAIKLIEFVAYTVLNLRQRVNDAARSVMIAYASGSDLDHLAALFGVIRLEIAPADLGAGTPAIAESDDELRRRVLLAPDSYSVAGPAGAYMFHALSADANVLDASAISPNPGEVTVTVLSREGDGTASQALLDTVSAYLSADDIRPLTDQVTVQSAVLTVFDVEADLTVFPGPDSQLILDTANSALDQLLSDGNRLGRSIARSAILAALHVGGVERVSLQSPAADVEIDQLSVARLGNRTVQIAGFAS